VPYPPGASTDQLARLLQDGLGPLLNRVVIVENRPGAGGNIGASHVAQAAPDSHIVPLATQPIVTMNPHLYKGLDFDALEDLTPLVSLAEGIVAIAVNPELPVHSIEELITYAKKNPGKLNYGSAGGNGSGQHIGMTIFCEQTGVDM